jgi:hypothetical protein
VDNQLEIENPKISTSCEMVTETMLETIATGLVRKNGP